MVGPVALDRASFPGEEDGIARKGERQIARLGVNFDREA
jgi:hypothetical protein